jgi:DNA topoisomerase-1
MANAVYATTTVKIDAAGERFVVTASKVKFDGFMSVYVQEDEKEKDTVLAKGLGKDSELSLQELMPKQHFTQPPAHYTEASLIRAMEELGIGRPSTYAPTITTILARRYVIKEAKNLFVTELGEVVNRMMKESFPSIVDVNFTANMEQLLDGVEEGNVKWKTIIANFYPDLEQAVQVAEKELEKVEIKDEESEVVCENCGRKMVIKYGPHGKFLACPGFPECRNTKPYYEKIGVACPKCGKDVVIKKTKKGRRFFGCVDNPECDFMSWARPSDVRCDKCGAYTVVRGNKLVCSNEKCGNIMNKPDNKEE